MQDSLTERPQQSPSENQIKLTQRDFIKLLIGGGASAILTACGIRPENARQVPMVNIEDLSKNPDLYAQMGILRASGYPQSVKKESVTAAVPQFDGSGNIARFDWFTTETTVYQLHTTQNSTSPSVNVIAKDVSLGPTGPSGLSANDKHEVTGKLTRVRNQDGTAGYYLDQKGIKKDQAK